MLIYVNIFNGASYGDRISLEVSKKDQVIHLKNKLSTKFDIPTKNQMLVYAGKTLIDDILLLDYKIKEDSTILLCKVKSKDDFEGFRGFERVNDTNKKEENIDNFIITESKFYQIGDFVDVVIDDTGAWYDGVIDKIFIKKMGNEKNNTTDSEDDYVFTVKSADHVVPEFENNVNFKNVRPRSYYIYKTEELHAGLIVLANCNTNEKDKKDELGLWYNFRIDHVDRTNVAGSILSADADFSIDSCSITLANPIWRIEIPQLIGERKDVPKYIPRKYPIYCETCKDNPRRKCQDCGCMKCRGKENPKQILLCDECEYGYHIYCLDPPLDAIPDGDWYCPDCKLDDSKIIKKGEMKLTKKQASMPNKTTKSNRDWGRGNACAGRSKICTLVPTHHFGPIPGIEVGMCWETRVQLSETGIHRPPVAGIHGKCKVGAFSIVLSGGYEDDEDRGDEFLYTGSGGRDLSGNKRVAADQTSDQQLTMANKALALNCHAQFSEKGAEASAENWRKGKPVRVVRNYKLKKRSKFAPRKGNRYDGIYKVIRYYPKKGEHGFVTWLYLLRRDDPAPAPWEEGGQEFEMILSQTNLKIKAEKDQNKENDLNEPGPSGTNKRKRDSLVTDYFTSPKKSKLTPYELPLEIKDLIEKDEVNKKYWAECSAVLKDGKLAFLDKIQQIFLCIVCQDFIYEPVTLECNHSFCKTCLDYSLKSKLDSCPCCRKKFSTNYEINENFSKALKLLLPGYGPGA